MKVLDGWIVVGFGCFGEPCGGGYGGASGWFFGRLMVALGGMVSVNFRVSVKIWKDESTGSWVVFSRKYMISGYGKTKKQALGMFLGSIKYSLAALATAPK